MASKDKPVPISSLQLEESQTRKAIYGVIGGVIKDTEIDTLTSRLNKWGYLFRWYLANVLKYKEQVEACTSHKETEKLKKKFHKEFKKIISEPVLHQQEALKKMAIIFMKQMMNFEKVKGLIRKNFKAYIKQETGSIKSHQFEKCLRQLFKDLSYPGSPLDWKQEVKFIIFDLQKLAQTKLDEDVTEKSIFDSLLKIASSPELEEMKRNLKEAEIKTDRDFIGMGKDEASSYEIDCELCLKSFSGAHFALGKKRYCLDCMICEYCQKIIPQKHWLVYQFTRSYDGKKIFRRSCNSCRDQEMDRCTACNEQIVGPYFDIVGKQWHKACLKCHYFKCPFYNKKIEKKYCVRQGLPYHRDCLEEIDENKY